MNRNGAIFLKKIHQMLGAYRYRLVLSIFYEVYLFCDKVFCYGPSKPKGSS